MITTQVMMLCFWICLGCILLAGVIGLSSIWIDDLWNTYRWAWKLEQTAGVFGITALAIAVVAWAFRFFVR